MVAVLLLCAWCGVAGAQRQGNDQDDGGSGDTAQTGPMPLGANLEGLADWARSAAFADLMKQARAFGTSDAPFDEKAPVGPDGWPTDDFGVVLFTGQGGVQNVGGVYHVSGTCNTSPEVRLISTRGHVGRVLYNTGSRQFSAEVTIDPDADQFFLSFRNTSGGIRDLRVMRPGYTTETFTKPFLDHLSRFHCLRFMNWSATNNCTVRTWSERTLPESPRYTTASGVPWEACIELANTVGADMWVNIPHLADDQYVTELARLVKARLRKDLRVYIEYSNEVWNFGFQQAAWNRDQAIAEVGSGDSYLDFDGETNPYYWAFRRVAARAKRVGEIFKTEFGEQAGFVRVRPVLAGQIANPEVLKQGLLYTEAVLGPPRLHFYALAGAPYFGLGESDASTNLSVDQVIAALDVAVRSVPDSSFYLTYAAMSKWYGLQFLAYEAGIDTFGPNNVVAKKAASHDPRLRPLCAKFLHDWYASGLGLINWYVAGATNWDGPFGTWGLTDDLHTAASPKLQAIDDVIALGPVSPILGSTVPGSVDARNFVGAPPDWQSRDPYLRLPVGGTYHDYIVRAPSPGLYQMNLLIAGVTAPAYVDVLINGRPVKLVTVQLAPTPESFGSPHPWKVWLDSGVNVVRLSFVTNEGYNVKSLQIQAPQK